MTRERVIVYRIEFRDGTVDLGLSYVHRSYLCFLAGRGGQDRVDTEKLTTEQIEHIRKLVEPMRCLSEHESIGDRRSIVIHRLTDIGRNIVGKIFEGGGP